MTPIVAIAPLIIIWVQSLTLSLVICATIVAIFPVIANTTLGLRSVHPGLASLFRMHGASRWQTLMRLAGTKRAAVLRRLRIASGCPLIGAVVAEFVAGTGGTGTGLPTKSCRRATS